MTTFRDKSKQMIKAEVEVLPALLYLDGAMGSLDLKEFRDWFDAEAEAIADYILEEARASRAYTDRTGETRKHFAKKKVKELDEEFWTVQWRWPTSHLLEFGHIQTDKNGRVLGHVAARPVLRPALQKGLAEALRRFGAR